MHPILFVLWGHPVPAYGVFVGLGFLAGLAIFAIRLRQRTGSIRQVPKLLLAAMAGGVAGAKLPVVIYYLPAIWRHPTWDILWTGKTILGGILGGWIAVEITKKQLAIREKTGDLFAPALALGEAIGRVGCFLGGCCYGIPTQVTWGCDFGDRVSRIPTQLLAMLFCLGLFVYLWSRRDRVAPGILFRRYLILYFGFRFFLEFIRELPRPLWGLTPFQIGMLASAGLAGLGALGWRLMKNMQQPVF